MKAPRIYRRSAGGGSHRLILGAALLVPLGVVMLVLTSLPAIGLASPFMTSSADQSVGIAPKRPVSSDPAPPPTLEAPTATPKAAPATDSAGSVDATATPQRGDTYVVKPGDELKQIAAAHKVSISKIIAINDIPNPDNLTIGQELRIPAE
jgi:LysM repeat protein